MKAKKLERGQRVRDHYLYRRWSWMRQVCYNPKAPDYAAYGGRGIEIGPEFESFWDFADIVEHRLGPPPNGFLSKLARKNQDGDWTIRNVEWDDAKTVGRRQRNAHRVTYKGKTKPLRQWAEELGINFYTLLNRVELGWSPAQILGYRPGPREIMLAKRKAKR